MQPSFTLPKIALIGRPNVGKSALFNAIMKRPIAIVDEEEGITRDRLYGTSEFFGRPFEIIDTGGLLGKTDTFYREITQQTEIAIEEADGIIVVVDGTFYEPHTLDIEVSRLLHRTKKPICLAVNKIDSFEKQEAAIQSFTRLGIQPIIAVSAAHRMNIAELMGAILSQLPVQQLGGETLEQREEAILGRRIAIVGRPNVGKSMLLNALLGESRAIVSPIAGTTRDMVDSFVEHNGEEYCFIDTAGIRRKHKEKVVVEKFAHMRTERAIERSDVCLLVVDCQDGMTHEEKKIASLIEETGRGCIVLINKWDLVKGFRMEHVMQGIEKEVPFLAHCPKLIISAKTGRNIDQIYGQLSLVRSAMNRRITTGQLNKALMTWMQAYHPPMIGKRRLRVYYMAQVGIHPPQFVLFVNSAALLDNGYKRYLTNQLRKTFEFQGVPFVLNIRGREDNPKTSQKQKKRDLEESNSLPKALRPVDKDLHEITRKLYEEEFEDATEDSPEDEE